MEYGRHDLPWRLPEADGAFDPYKIVVSELMLQQTQVPRVIPKFAQFLTHFPSVQDLANAELADVLTAWQGLGYNRRAKYLWQSARMICDDFSGKIPESPELAQKLPGVGPNTAAAIAVYAFNQPEIFIETNIRTVFIYHFFSGKQDITDRQILLLLEQTLDRENPREFYWALMDYGTFLKQTRGNNIRASKSYHKQPPLEGSHRQIRGQILRHLTVRPESYGSLTEAIPDPRLPDALHDLEAENLIIRHKNLYRLYSEH